MNYKTYAEAKIANPDSEIVTTGKNWGGGKDFIGTFEAVITGSIRKHIIDDISWAICNPADYCSSVKEFLEAGFKFYIDDIYTSIDGSAIVIDGIYDATNSVQSKDSERYILSAAALNGGCKIPAKAEQWTIYNNTLPLCELTDEQAAALFNWWRGGGETEFKLVGDNPWYSYSPMSFPTWSSNVAYRAKQKSERELFIEAAIGHGIKPETQSPKQIFGELFDSGKFKYIDNPQHFGENI